MDKQRSKEITVGIVTFLAIGLLFLGISLGKGFQVASEDKLLKIRFPNSGGLQVSEPVVVNGVKRGSVISVKNDKSSVLVSVLLDNYDDIKSDATAKITLLEITGGKKVEIYPGKMPNKLILKNELQGITPPDLSELVALVGEVSGDAVSLVRRLDTIASSATELLADGKVVEDVKQTLKNANELSANLNQFVDNNYTKLESSIKNLNDLSLSLKNAVDRHEPTVGRILNEIEITLNDARVLVANIDSTVSGANSLVANMNKLSDDLRNGDGFATKMLFDKGLNERLDSTFTNLSVLLDMIKNHGVNVNVRLGSRP
jgi:phospholipid/cholesterol/gamma-HCH transport system substrate-binding protein